MGYSFMMSLKKWFRRAAGMSLVCASVVSVAPLGGSVAPVVSAQASLDPGGEFHALTPKRILDTRPGTAVNDVAPFGAKPMSTNAPVDNSAEFKFNPLGKGGLPSDAAGVLAIVANVTVTQPTVGGWVAVYPSDFDFGGPTGKDEISSLVNFPAKASVPNLVIVGLDAAGNVTFNSGAGSAGRYHLIIDVVGFISTSQYSSTSVGARLESVNPGRLLDTRKGSPIGPGQTRSLKIRGAHTIVDDGGSAVRPSGVPNDVTVTAVMVNLTLINPANNGETYLSATPEKIDTSKFHTSSSNVGPGGIMANMAVVPIGADGSIKLYNNLGNLDVVVDVLGYFQQGIYAEGNRGRIVPLEAPFRAFDTRKAEFGSAALQHGSQEEWSFQNFTESVVLNPDSATPTTGPPQQALIGSLVGIGLAPLYPSHAGTGRSSYLRLAPANAAPAETSNINPFLGIDVANMSLIKYGTSGSDNRVVEAYNNYGQVHYLLDVYAIVLDD